MPSRAFLELPAEIRNNVYRHLLCYDGITPEVRSPYNPWLSHNFHTGPRSNLLPICQDPPGDTLIERSGLRMQLDVMAPIRNGIYHVVQPVVLASDILSLLRACRLIYEEAHPIFWAENVFIFPDQDIMHLFSNRIGAKSLDFIRTLGIEKTVSPDWINLHGSTNLAYWFGDLRIPPIRLPPYLHNWETGFEEYDCEREHWFTCRTIPSEGEMRKCMVPCKTIYKWLTRPPISEIKPVKDNDGIADDGLYDIQALEESLSRKCLILSEGGDTLA